MDFIELPLPNAAPADTAEKKPYTAPCLECHGTVARKTNKRLPSFSETS